MKTKVARAAHKLGVSRQAIWNKVSHRIYAMCAEYMKLHHPKEHSKIRDFVYGQFGVVPRSASVQLKRLETALNGKRKKR